MLKWEGGSRNSYWRCVTSDQSNRTNANRVNRIHSLQLPNTEVWEQRRSLAIDWLLQIRTSLQFLNKDSISIRPQQREAFQHILSGRITFMDSGRAWSSIGHWTEGSATKHAAFTFQPPGSLSVTNSLAMWFAQCPCSDQRAPQLPVMQTYRMQWQMFIDQYRSVMLWRYICTCKVPFCCD